MASTFKVSPPISLKIGKHSKNIAKHSKNIPTSIVVIQTSMLGARSFPTHRGLGELRLKSRLRPEEAGSLRTPGHRDRDGERF